MKTQITNNTLVQFKQDSKFESLINAAITCAVVLTSTFMTSLILNY